MANGATFSQRGVLEDKRPRLFTVAVAARLVRTSQGQSPGGLKNIAPMRIMALHAVHLLLKDWMMLWQVEFGFD
jgi:hypothetical protein